MAHERQMFRRRAQDGDGKRNDLQPLHSTILKTQTSMKGPSGWALHPSS